MPPCATVRPPSQFIDLSRSRRQQCYGGRRSESGVEFLKALRTAASLALNRSARSQSACQRRNHWRARHPTGKQLSQSILVLVQENRNFTMRLLILVLVLSVSGRPNCSKWYTPSTRNLKICRTIVTDDVCVPWDTDLCRYKTYRAHSCPYYVCVRHDMPQVQSFCVHFNFISEREGDGRRAGRATCRRRGGERQLVLYFLSYLGLTRVLLLKYLLSAFCTF